MPFCRFVSFLVCQFVNQLPLLTSRSHRIFMTKVSSRCKYKGQKQGFLLELLHANLHDHVALMAERAVSNKRSRRGVSVQKGEEWVFELVTTRTQKERYQFSSLRAPPHTTRSKERSAIPVMMVVVKKTNGPMQRVRVICEGNRSCPGVSTMFLRSPRHDHF